MKPADIRLGLLLRVINSHGLGAPLQSLATVETIEKPLSGYWYCTIRYHDKRQTKRDRLYRSHLWASDLGCFEIVKDGLPTQEKGGRGAARPNLTGPQLSLPFTDDGDYII
jgi:hypothetical protein